MTADITRRHYERVRRNTLGRLTHTIKHSNTGSLSLHNEECGVSGTLCTFTWFHTMTSRVEC